MRKIDNIQDYDLAVKIGQSPQIDRHFTLSHDVRMAVQERLFGKGNHEDNNIRFYKWCWEHKQHYCEECLRPLDKYSSVYVSHILSRGAHPEKAYDPRNVNILCPSCHARWENGDRERMRIYSRNVKVINDLTLEYQKK